MDCSASRGSIVSSEASSSIDVALFVVGYLYYAKRGHHYVPTFSRMLWVEQLMLANGRESEFKNDEKSFWNSLLWCSH